MDKLSRLEDSLVELKRCSEESRALHEHNKNQIEKTLAQTLLTNGRVNRLEEKSLSLKIHNNKGKAIVALIIFIIIIGIIVQKITFTPDLLWQIGRKILGI
jgi:hypothetical protein